MKKGLIIFISLAALAACNTSGTKTTAVAGTGNALKDTTHFTTIQWLDSIHRNLGTVVEGDLVEVTFRFKNTGTSPLIITSVTASCGCTIPETPKEPFAPGAEGLIKAKFNSQNRAGTNHKQVYVTANTKPDNLQQLEFTIDVEKKKPTN